MRLYSIYTAFIVLSVSILILLMSFASVFLVSYLDARKVENAVKESIAQSVAESTSNIALLYNLQQDVCIQPNCTIQRYLANGELQGRTTDSPIIPDANNLSYKQDGDKRFWLKSVALGDNAGSMRFRQQIAIEPLIRLLPYAALLFLILPWLLLYKTLGPLRRLSIEARAIDPHDPEPELLSVQGPTEVRQLSTSLKQSLGTIKEQQSQERMRYKWFHHELTQPNAVAIGELELLNIPDLDLGEQDVESVQIIQRSLEETGFILSAMAQYLYLDNLVIADPQDFDLRDICNQAVSLYPGIRLELPSEPCTIHGSRFFIRRVLQNLLHNANRVVSGPEDISIVVKKEGQQATMLVCDKGPGIPADVQPLLFQGTIDIERKKGGRGIGLWYAKLLVELHHGSIAVSSENSNKEYSGACFEIVLPLKSKEVLPT